MQSVPLIQYAWELRQAGVHVDEISIKVNKHRATLYRWFKEYVRWALEDILENTKEPKKVDDKEERYTDL